MHSAYLVMLIGALGLVAFAILLGHRDAWKMTLCAAAVSVNWFVNTLYVVQTGDTDPELMFLATDLASLALVSWATGAASWGGVLASSYAGQIIMHLIHWTGQGDAYWYWQVLTGLGYVQLLLLAAWSLSVSRRGVAYE